MAGYPAESAGILKDDLIVSIEERVSILNPSEIIYKNKSSVKLELLRNNEKVELP